MGFHGGGANSIARSSQVRSKIPSFFRWRSTLGRIACVLFVVGALAASPALCATSQSKIRRQAPSETQRVRVPMVAEPWAATATTQPTAPGKRSAQFIGHYPGYAAAKQAVNERLKRLLQSPASRQVTTSAAPLAAASALVTFDGPNESETQYIPPDSQLATGPSDIVAAINDLLAIYDKTGTLQGSIQQLPTFFSSLGVNGQIFDPRLIYDQTDGRFILSVAEVDTKNFATGDVLLAVSATSDPTGVWYKYAINFMGRDASNTVNTFPDFPGLGLSPTAVYLTSNQFELNSQCVGGEQSSGCKFSDAWIKVIDLQELLSGSPTLNITTFQNVTTAGGNQAFGIQPALNYGAPGDEFLVAADFSSNPGTLLNLFSLPTSGTLTLASADLTVPSFSLPPDAPQPASTNAIMTDDFRILNAVWSNGSLWCGQNVDGTTGQATARWYQIALTNLTSAALTQSGDVTGAGAAYYPALGVRADGTVAMVFTTSTFTTPASAAYTGREPSDPAGTMRSYAVFRVGLGPYDETVGNRWGDYSGLSLDPGGTSLWGIAEYAGAPDPNFGTEIAEISGEPSLEASPGSLDFGEVLAGQQSAEQSFTVTNVSSNAVTLGTASVGGVNFGEFSLSNDQCSGATLAAGASCSVSVTFAPSQNGVATAAVSVGDQDGKVTVGVGGTGISKAILSASPTTLNFPNTVQQTASAPLTLTVTNTGNEQSDISSVDVYGPFAATDNCGPTLAAGASCQFQITFYPIAASTYQNDMTLQYNSSSSPLFIYLNGTGVTAPAAVPCPTALNFGNQAQGTTSNPQTVILTNTGSASLTISGVTTSGDFAATSSCPATLDPRASCSIAVTFTPTTLASESGTLSIGDSAAGSPQVVTLAGTGVSSAAAARAAGTVAVASALRSRARKAARAAARLVRVLRPLGFAPNRGQFRSGLRYVAHVPGYALAVTRAGLELEMPVKESAGVHSSAGHGQTSHLVRVQMNLSGANPNAVSSGVDELPGKANYFFGRNPRAWRTNVPTYARVRLRNVYPGVDLVYYGNQRRLEYDFLVHPGADPARIRLVFAGATTLRLDSAGDLLLETRAGVVRLHKPVVYQPVSVGPSGSTRIDRRGRWVVQGTDVAAFRLGRYDHREPLVIDPVLTFSTYLGGSGGDEAYAVAVGSQGNIYLAGMTSSNDFPTTSNAFQTICGVQKPSCNSGVGIADGFVSKLSADGSTLLYSTYLGGLAMTQIHGIAVDSAGDAYVVGPTSTDEFPTTTGALKPQCPPLLGPQTCPSSFVTKLNSTGSGLLYSTYLGGTPTSQPNLQDVASAVAVDAAGDAWVGGAAASTDFPTTAGAFQTTNATAGTTDGFLSELNPAGSALLYSTLIGGSSDDVVNGVALDSAGNAYITGTSYSVNFPTTQGAFQTGSYGDDAFVAKFSAGGTLVFSTLLGGSSQDSGTAIAVDAAGAAYVTGRSQGSFPVTLGAFEATGGGAFVAKVHPQGCALEYSTYVAGDTNSAGQAIAVDSAGDAYVAGDYGFEAPSGTVPLFNALQPALSQNNALVAELNPQGTNLVFSTPLGGSNGDQAYGIALDSQDDIYVAGVTDSTDFPAVNALQPIGTGTSAFLARISPGQPSPVTMTRSSLTFMPVAVGTVLPSGTEGVGLMNNQSVALNIQGVTVSGSGFSLPTSSIPCSGSITPGAGCIVAVQFDPTATGAATGTVTITDDAPGSPRQVALNGTGLADFNFGASMEMATPPLVGATSINYSVYVSPETGVTSLSGDVSLSCSGNSPATCTFSPTTLPATGGNGTLTVGNLSAVGDTPLTFDIVGTLGSQSASVAERIALQDFSLSASSTSATVTAGGSATYQLTLAPINGFDYNVTLACSGLPAYSTCSFSPAGVTLDGQNSANDTVTINTTSRSLVPPPGPPDFLTGAPLLVMGWCALGTLLLLAFWLAGFRRRRLWLPALLVLLLAASVSCGGGGGSSGSGSSGATATGTPAGTYSITVTGAYSTASHTVKLSLTVQ